VSVICLVVAAGIAWIIKRTKLGMMVRAGSTNREMVQALGINIQQLYRLVFAVGVALAVLAGMIAAPLASVYPRMGDSVLILCFVIVVIGGIGSIKGAMVAALLIGFVDTFGKVFWQEGAGAMVYLAMALVLLWRPEGLFKAA
jgi:branched-chain amino acid transport system permease protein